VRLSLVYMRGASGKYGLLGEYVAVAL